MAVWSWLGPKLYDPFLALGELRGMRRWRSELLAQANGRVLEIGAGTGLNLGYYSAADDLVLSEPDTQMAHRLKTRATAHPLSPTVSIAGADDLPYDADSFDCVVSTLVLCTVPDPSAALAEVRRVLRPGGRFLFIEHVRSDKSRVARWQDRLQRAWGPFAMGCHCNRDTQQTLADHGWTVDALQRSTWRHAVHRQATDHRCSKRLGSARITG